MSFKNVHYDKRKGIMYLWDNEIESNHCPKEIEFVPYVFVKDSKETGIKSVFGDNVIKREFNSYFEYQKFCDSASKVNTRKNRFIFENKIKPELQFCSEMYYGIPDDEIEVPKLEYSCFDIEVDTTFIDDDAEVVYHNGHELITSTLKEVRQLKHVLVQVPGMKELQKFDERHFLKVYGFPDPEEAICPICMISIYNSKINKIFTFGLKDYDGNLHQESWFRYIRCANEQDLLNKFFNFMYKTSPDIITGWNINKFDFPYIINRVIRLYSDKQGELMDKGKEFLSLLSPIKQINYWKKTTIDDVTKQEVSRTFLDIAGISILDYIELYKQYSLERVESFSLDYISKHELEKGKIEYTEYKNLTNLYHFNYNLYLEYNVVDVKRVKQIHEKLDYFSLVQSLSLLAKCPMKFCGAVTHVSEGAIATYCRRNNLCLPFAYNDGTKEDFKGGDVKEPQVGLYDWLIDLDITSSYPTHMIALNMGPETYVGCITSVEIDGERINPSEMQVVEYTSKRSFPPFLLLKENYDFIFINNEKLDAFNKALKQGRYTIAPNGVIFSTSKPGLIASIEKYLFGKRKDVKEKQYKVGIERSKIKQGTKEYDDIDNKFSKLKNLQIAIKVVLNGLYGAQSVPYFRLFNPYVAKAITSGGRWAVKQGELYTNDLLANPSKSNKLMEVLNELESLKTSR